MKLQMGVKHLFLQEKWKQEHILEEKVKNLTKEVIFTSALLIKSLLWMQNAKQTHLRFCTSLPCAEVTVYQRSETLQAHINKKLETFTSK